MTADRSGPSGHPVSVEPDALPSGWTLDRVREVGQLRAAPRLLDPATPVTIETSSGVEPVDASVLIECGDLILVLDSDDGAWLMGQHDADGAVRCWASYGTDLGVALRSL